MARRYDDALRLLESGRAVTGNDQRSAGRADTDALRDAAWDKYAALNGIHPHSIERDTFEQGWDAAADEVDRLRAALVEARAASDRYSQELSEHREQMVLNEGRLRAVIENAPHDRDASCGFWYAPQDMSHCTCWNADAL